MEMGENLTKSAQAAKRASTKEWKKLVAEYQQPHVGRAVWQIVNTLVPIAAIWVSVYFLKDISLWLTIPPALLGGLFLVRAFIIFHDCGHGSFFKSKRANTAVGFITGMLTFTLTVNGVGSMHAITPPTVISTGEASAISGR